MNFLVIVLFVSVFATNYLVRGIQVLSGEWILVPEALSGIALLVVLARMIAIRNVQVDWRYGVFFLLFGFVLLFGFFAQSVPAGAVVSGLRNYAKFIPFFLLPVVYPFTSRDLKLQIGVLLAILAVQTPLAVYQRFVQYAASMHTGDPIRGMATSSSSLSLVMLGAIAVFVALYLYRKIRLWMLLLAVAVYFIPTTLNETKGTVLILPVALLAPAFFMPRGSKALRRIVPVAGIGALALFVYVLIYNSLVTYSQYGHSIGAFFGQGYVESYIYTGAAEGEGHYIGRVDSVELALKTLAQDPLALAFGLGAGNVSTSSLPGFDGAYASYYGRFGVDTTQVSSFLWEIGIVGLAAYLLLYWCAFRDARYLAKTGGPLATFGTAWATMLIIMTMALMYKAVFTINEIAYLFWFYSGVVARNAHLARAAATRRAVAPRGAPAGAGLRCGEVQGITARP
jgi:hypothetical protein